MAESTLPQPSSSICTMDIVNGDKNNSFCDASFSSYLRVNEETRLVELVDLFKKPSLGVNLTDETFFSISKTGGVHSEIRVFDAENYFKTEIGDGSPASGQNSLSNFSVEKSKDRLDRQVSRAKNLPGNLSTASYESSCGSSPSAFPSSIRTPSQKERKDNGKQFLAGFAFKGSSSEAKSVHVNKNGFTQAKEFLKKTLQLDQSWTIGHKEDKLPFPNLKSRAPNKSTVAKRQTEEENPEDGRDSIEVFGSHHMLNKGDILQNLERKLSVLTWDAIPQTPKVKSNISRTSMTCDREDGGDSDSSSDLFEIENIGNVSRKPPLVRQQSDGDMSFCMTPTTLYAPSEASIAWSVVTARASDFRAATEYDELRISGPSSSTNKHEILKSFPVSGLLGCENDKAVQTVEPAYKK